MVIMIVGRMGMLLGGIGIVSALAAIALLGLGAVSPVWAVPVFALLYLGLALLAFGFLCLACGLVDLKKPQLHDSRFYRWLMHLYIDALVTLMQVRIHTWL